MKKLWILPIAAMMTVACGGGASALEEAAAEMEAAMEEAAMQNIENSSKCKSGCAKACCLGCKATDTTGVKVVCLPDHSCCKVSADDSTSHDHSAVEMEVAVEEAEAAVEEAAGHDHASH